jgi:hypothetical protein
MRRKIVSGCIAAFTIFITWAMPKYLEVNGMITPQNSYWLLYAIYIGVFIVVCILIWGFWPTIKRIRFQKPIKLQKSQTNTDKVEETRIRSSIPGFTQKHADWMAMAIQDDLRDLPGCVMVRESHICWEHLEEREDAYIEFNFDIWSSSVLLLEISKQVEGHICFRGGELERIPEITQKASQLSHLRRSRFVQLKIRQWLSFPVKARMKTEYGSQVEFDFSKVNISVVATLLDGSQGSTCRLPIPDVIHVQMPNHPNALDSSSSK